MKRQRRTKEDMEYAWDTAYLYLMSNDLDVDKAYKAMERDYFLRGKPVPYYIKGKQDFIRVLNNIKTAQEVKRQQEEERQNVINKLKEITIERWNQFYERYKGKEKVNDIQMTLTNVRMAMHLNDYTILSQEDIYIIKSIGLV